MPPFVLIIILNYNSYIETLELTESLKNIKYGNYDYLVIDNNSTDNSQKTLKEKIDDKNLLLNGQNRGYAAGNNKGIEVAFKKNADYVWILNPDIRIEDDTLTALVAELEKDNQIAAIGPRICFRNDKNIIYSDGGRIYPEKGFIVTTLNNGKNISEVDNSGLNTVEYVNGSAILMRLSTIENIDKFREDFFLYFEETEWCMRALKFGWKIVTNPNTKVYHMNSQKDKRYYYFMTRNRIWLSKLMKGPLKKTLYYEFSITKKILVKAILSLIFQFNPEGLKIFHAKIAGIFYGVFYSLDR